MLADPDTPEDLFEKILAYVEREAGRDAPLSFKDEKMVRELLLKDPAARALANEFRNVDTGLKAMFQALGRIPVSDDLMRRIQAQEEAFEIGDIDASAGKLD
jgi:anti-sigma factor RsiW